MIPTKRGMGVEIWGTYGDLHVLYDIIGKFWNKEDINSINIKASSNRDKAISGFSYEIRKAFEGSRLARPEGAHFFYSDGKYLGMKISWPQFYFR